MRHEVREDEDRGRGTVSRIALDISPRDLLKIGTDLGRGKLLKSKVIRVF